MTMKRCLRLMVFAVVIGCAANTQNVFGGSTLVMGSYCENGTMSSGTEINLTAGTFSGNGLLMAPIINMKIKEFKFTGTIDCSLKCIIKVKKDFDRTMFKRAGKGEFIIEVEKD